MARSPAPKMKDESLIEAAEAAQQSIAAADYAENMFRDGKQAHTPSKRTAQGYDEAVARDDDASAIEDNTVEMLGNTSADTLQSRDGTDAAGRDDEAGGSLGGTEEELDQLEASAVPVDKLAHMKV